LAFLQNVGKDFYNGIGQGRQPRKKKALWITERDTELRRRASECLRAFLGGKRNGNGVTAFMLNISHRMTGIMAMDTCSWLRMAEGGGYRRSEWDKGAKTGVLS